MHLLRPDPYGLYCDLTPMVYLKFQFEPYNDMIVDGTIVSGCVILGRFDTIGYSGGNYDSDFVGNRIP